MAGSETTVKRLLAQEDVDVNARDRMNATPLQLAVSWEYKAVVEILLAHDRVDKACTDSLDRTPLNIAANRGHKAVIESLLARGGVDVNSGDMNNETPLFRAASKGHEAIVRLLLDQGANPTIRNIFGRTPLHVAQDEAIKQLLSDKIQELAETAVEAEERSFTDSLPDPHSYLDDDEDTYYDYMPPPVGVRREASGREVTRRVKGIGMVKARRRRRYNGESRALS